MSVGFSEVISDAGGDITSHPQIPTLEANFSLEIWKSAGLRNPPISASTGAFE
jgi:hypothetical protein